MKKKKKIKSERIVYILHMLGKVIDTDHITEYMSVCTYDSIPRKLAFYNVS